MRRQALATDGPREEVRKPESKKQRAKPQKNAKGVEMTELDGNGVDEIPNLALSVGGKSNAPTTFATSAYLPAMPHVTKAYCPAAVRTRRERHLVA